MKMTDFLDKNTRIEAQNVPVFNLNNEEKEAQLEAKIKVLEEKIGVLEPIKQAKEDIEGQLATQRALNTQHFSTIENLNKQVADLTIATEDKVRVMGTFDGLKKDNERLAGENGEAVHVMSNLRMDLLTVQKEVEQLRTNNANLDSGNRSMLYASTQKDSLLKELTQALDDLRVQHERLAASSDELATQYKEVFEKRNELDKINLQLTSQVAVMQQQQQEAVQHEKEALRTRENIIETRVSSRFQSQIDELIQDVQDLVTLNNHYKTELRKPNRSSIGAIAKQEAFKLPLASNAINYRKNNLGTGTVTLPRFKKEIS